jgi:tetratricopeptide (TPR) repeat protein
MVVPLDLIPFYPYPQDVLFSSPEYFLPVVLVLGITITCIVITKRRRVWLAAWGYYVVTLIPAIGIVQIGNTSMADRYSYLPSVGPFLIAGLLAALMPKAMDSLKQRRPAVLFAYVASAVLVFGSLSYLTLNQIRVWKNSIDLWGYVIEKEPDAVPLAYYNRGLAYVKNGQFGRARADFSKTIELDPSDYRAYNNLGVMYGQLGQFDRAIECFSITLYLNKDYDVAYMNRGKFYDKTGNRERAVADYQKACDLGNTNGCRALQRALSTSRF